MPDIPKEIVVKAAEPETEIVGDTWPEGVSDGLALPCVLCGKATRFDYTVADVFWKTVVAEEDMRGVICLPCLSRLASAHGKHIAHWLQQVQFVGDGETIVMKPTRVILYETGLRAKNEKRL